MQSRDNPIYALVCIPSIHLQPATFDKTNLTISNRRTNMTTRDGFYLQNDNDLLQKGLRCAGAINPPTNVGGKRLRVYDVIVVGAGYSGLTACRDLCIAGR